MRSYLILTVLLATFTACGAMSGDHTANNVVALDPTSEATPVDPAALLAQIPEGTGPSFSESALTNDDIETWLEDLVAIIAAAHQKHFVRFDEKYVLMYARLPLIIEDHTLDIAGDMSGSAASIFTYQALGKTIVSRNEQGDLSGFKNYLDELITDVELDYDHYVDQADYEISGSSKVHDSFNHTTDPLGVEEVSTALLTISGKYRAKVFVTEQFTGTYILDDQGNQVPQTYTDDATATIVSGDATTICQSSEKQDSPDAEVVSTASCQLVVADVSAALVVEDAVDTWTSGMKMAPLLKLFRMR